MSRLAAALAGLARQTEAPALERFDNEGFIRFHNSLQRLRLIERQSGQEAMPPTIGRGRMDAAALGGFGQADALDHRLRIVEPAILLRNRAIPVRVAALKVRSHALQRYLGKPCDRPQPTISSAPQCAQPRRSTLPSPIVASRSRASLEAFRRSPASVDDAASSRGSMGEPPPTSPDRRARSPSSPSASPICSPLNRAIPESQPANSPRSIAKPSAASPSYSPISPTRRYRQQLTL